MSLIILRKSSNTVKWKIPLTTYSSITTQQTPIHQTKNHLRFHTPKCMQKTQVCGSEFSGDVTGVIVSELSETALGPALKREEEEENQENGPASGLATSSAICIVKMRLYKCKIAIPLNLTSKTVRKNVFSINHYRIY